MDTRIKQVVKLQQQGLSNRKIAQILGLSHTLINRWLKQYADQPSEVLLDDPFPSVAKVETLPGNRLETVEKQDIQEVSTEDVPIWRVELNRMDYQKYAEQMDLLFKELVETVLIWQGKYVARSRIVNLLQKVTENAFEKNRYYNDWAKQYHHDKLFRKLRLALGENLNECKGYQLILSLDPLLIKEIHQAAK